MPEYIETPGISFSNDVAGPASNDANEFPTRAQFVSSDSVIVEQLVDGVMRFHTGWNETSDDIISATTSSATVVVASTEAWVHRVTLSHNVSTLTITKPVGLATKSKIFVLVLKQGTGGQNTWAMPSNAGSYVNIVFPGNVVPVIATGTDGIESEWWFRWDGVKDKFIFSNYVGTV